MECGDGSLHVLFGAGDTTLVVYLDKRYKYLYHTAEAVKTL